MKSYLYKLDCLTNLHVGSGDANYSVIDNEVEKDEALGCPIIHSSGVKGALRDYVADEDKQVAIFGSPASDKKGAKPGICKFLDACLLSRPMRCRLANNTTYTGAFIQVTTPAMINQFVRLTSSLGCMPIEGLREVTDADLRFSDSNFLCTDAGVRVEDENTKTINEQNLANDLLVPLKALLGEHFAIARSLDDFPLPVVARNKLEQKISKNLWYEEYVPHHSVFYLIVLLPDKVIENADLLENMAWLKNPDVVQFGGNASVGFGYTKITRWEAQAE